jgi:predicted nucleic acid-binding protein
MLDSDVLIDYLRRHPAAVAFIQGLKQRPLLSAVSVAELYSGVRDGEERVTLDTVVGGFRVIAVTRAMAVRAGLHRRQYRKSHNVQLADALIAATAEEMDAELFTLNIKHFPMLPGANAPYQKA